MTRDYENEFSIFDEAVDLFGTVDDFVFAINTEIKKDGEKPLSRQAIIAWGRNGIPAERVRIFEAATGGAFTREKIRPDLYA